MRLIDSQMTIEKSHPTLQPLMKVILGSEKLEFGLLLENVVFTLLKSRDGFDKSNIAEMIYFSCFFTAYDQKGYRPVLLSAGIHVPVGAKPFLHGRTKSHRVVRGSLLTGAYI